MKTIHHLAAACYLAATLFAGIGLASCTEEVYTPGADADLTTQPLILTASMAASADAPATRANTARGEWTEGDWVAVEVNDVVKKYLVHIDNGVATLRPADIDNTHFWPDLQQSVSVRAWRYGDDATWNKAPYFWYVSGGQHFMWPSGESDYQRSDFLYAPAKSLSYSPETGAGLTFYHQTARIVVRIRETGVVTVDNKEIIDVCIGVNKNNYQLLMEGTFDAGRIAPATGQYSGLTADLTGMKGYVVPKPIPEPGTGYARSYEALVIPQDMSNKALIEVTLNGKNYQYTPTSANLQGGYTYIYDVTVSEHGTLQVSASEPIPGWVDSEKGGSGMAYEVVLDLNQKTTINDNRTYLMTGTKENVSTLVYITGGAPTIILRDLDITDVAYPISISSGTPIFKVEGENRIISDKGAAINVSGETTNVRIIGDGRNESQLTVKAGWHATLGAPAIGSDINIGGSISLSDLTLIAKGTTSADSRFPASAAAIGTNAHVTDDVRKCGSITITNCHVEATAGGPGAAAIGFGYYDGDDTNRTHEMGDITITNSTLKCTVEKGPNDVWPAHIGGSSKGKGQYTVGKITITPPEGTHGTEFFKDFTKGDGSAMLDNDVIVGFPEGAKTTNGAEFDVYWNNRLQGPVIRWGDRGGLQ